ncbi:MAG: sulfatase-like hydrolase/transferase, partial [bacterium]|nr:sulfatase-like hydrolase/transferase [bacterium]
MGAKGPHAETLRTEQPNVLWLSCEDIGPHLGCYGDPLAHTPTLDQMAREGVRYANAYTTAGVCAPNRSSIITGVHATTLGTHHMRSGGEGVLHSVKPSLPEGIRCFPAYLREAGYYCTNNAKQDYQVPTPPDTWDESSKKAHWRDRPDPETPFFAVFNYTGSHEGSIRLSAKQHAERTKRLTDTQRQNPDDMTPPPFHPNTEIVRREWAELYELITAMDYWLADMLEQLEEDGLADNTIVI